MRKTFYMLGLTFLSLMLMDLAVAGALGWAERHDRFGSLVQYFNYGRSVPGKHARWEEHPEMSGNLYDVAWRAAALRYSAEEFVTESRDDGPVVRSYGMSFVNNILAQAKTIDPALQINAHAGPGAPPNFTYTLFLDDRSNRRAGDIVVLGILSSSVSAMAALSNQTWVFEQPAPFTYPIFHPEGAGLRRINPLIESAAQHREPALAIAWQQQLAREDAFYSQITYGASWLDRSPFVRLIRRSAAKSHIQRTERGIIADRDYPYERVLRNMIATFAVTARADGQTPVVMLIQSRAAGDPDLLRIAQPVLEQNEIPYLATAAFFDPKDPSGFLPDGHYKTEIDKIFANAFLDLITSN